MQSKVLNTSLPFKHSTESFIVISSSDIIPSLEKLPSFENEKPARYRTIERIIKEILPTGESVEEVIECNGKHHRRCVDKITYDANGDIDFVEQLFRVELGECNHNHS